MPNAELRLGQKQAFDSATGLAPCLESGGQHLGLIEHEAVVGPKAFCQIAKVPVLDLARVPVNHHQPGGISGLAGPLGDQVWGEVVIEVGP